MEYDIVQSRSGDYMGPLIMTDSRPFKYNVLVRVHKPQKAHLQPFKGCVCVT